MTSSRCQTCKYLSNQQEQKVSRQTTNFELKFHILSLENALPQREIRVRRSAQGPPPPLPAAKAQLGGRIRKQQPIFDDEEVYRAPTFAEDRADLPIAGSSYSPKHPKGKVGPVYTFVKTDYDANFKWGVRHVAGQKYAGRR